jgi:PAS domain S-box-containing protein
MTDPGIITTTGRPPRVVPTGMERRLNVNDVIVSETDLRGHITYANDVFERVAAYRRADLIGQPHNLVRHPSMPQCVFKLLWDTIQSGRDIRAFVINLAGDGAHYWVLAHVFPLVADEGIIMGYRSERWAPSHHAVETISGVYAMLLQTERAAGGGRAGMEAANAQLVSLLNSRGLSYEQFVSSLL